MVAINELLKYEPKPRKKPVRHEDKLHTDVAKWLTAAIGHPGEASATLGVMWLSLETRAKRSLREGAANKARGCVAGVPDIEIVQYPGRCFKIELKSAKGVVSDQQRKLHKEYRILGIPVAVCRSIDDVRAALLGWGVPTREAG